MTQTIYLLFLIAKLVSQQSLVEFRDLHQSAAAIANEAGRTAYIYGPFARDLFDCIERAREIGIQAGDIHDYGIKVTQGSNVLSYEYVSLNNIYDLESTYRPVDSFTCVRFNRNNNVIVNMNSSQ